jgi:O-antigen/teichoic acid export membrane protein
MENFFISSFFNLSQFTYYSVGCFENPLVNAARSSTFEITNISMIDANKNDGPEAAAVVWKNMTRTLFLVIIPLVIYMMFFGKEIIIFIFSEKYLASVPFFIIFNLYLIVGIRNPEPMFRTMLKTHMALKLKFFGLILGVSLLISGAIFGGALWALIGKIVGVFLMNIAGVIVGAKLLKTTFFKLFAWKDLGISFLIAISSSFLLHVIFLHVSWHPFWVLALTFAIYTIVNLYLLFISKIITSDEIAIFIGLIAKPLKKIRFG